MVLQVRRLPEFAGQVGPPRRELGGADAEGDGRAALPGGPLKEGELDGAFRIPEEHRAVAGGPELVLTHRLRPSTRLYQPSAAARSATWTWTWSMLRTEGGVDESMPRTVGNGGLNGDQRLVMSHVVA